MGVPRNHPFIDGFSRKSTIHLGIPPFISFMKTPSWHPWEDFACPCCIVYMVFFLVCRTPSFSCLICHVCWECILMLCCLSKNMLLGFVRHVFTCCIDKYQYMLLGNLIIDYLAWFVSAPHVFLCCNINNLMLQWPDVFFLGINTMSCIIIGCSRRCPWGGRWGDRCGDHDITSGRF